MCGCEVIPKRRGSSLYSDLYQRVLLLCSSSRHCRSCSYSAARATILICSSVRFVCVCACCVYAWVNKRNKQGRSSESKQECVVIFTSSSYWTIKAESVWMIAYRVSQPAADLWPHSNSIFGAAVHKSQTELLTVNWLCQHAQLIQRLCQAIVILCIETGGPDSPYTTVNGRYVSGKLWPW